MRKPTSLLLPEGFYLTAIDKFIAFEKLFDKRACSEASIFAHMKISGISRECEPPSKQLPGWFGKNSDGGQFGSNNALETGFLSSRKIGSRNKLEDVNYRQFDTKSF
jgi:hypothetical protein